MQPHRSQVLHALSQALQGRFSLQVVVMTTIALFWLVLILISYMLLLRLYYYLKNRYMSARRKLYEPAIELVLMDEPQEKVLDALAPRRWGDGAVVQDVILDSMRHLEGQPFSTLQSAAVKLGFMDRNLRLLKSRNKLKRGSAMEALGVMRAHAAMIAIIAMLPKEPRDMKLVALRSLALIGDPFALPYYEREAETLPPTMLPRLASLMLEFGPEAKPFIETLIRDRPEAFPRRVMQLLLNDDNFRRMAA